MYFILQNSHNFTCSTCVLFCSSSYLDPIFLLVFNWHLAFFFILFTFASVYFLHFSSMLLYFFFLIFTFLSLSSGLSTVSQYFPTTSALMPPATLLEVKTVPVSSFFQSSRNERLISFFVLDSLICFLICSHKLHFNPFMYQETDGTKVLQCFLSLQFNIHICSIENITDK